MKIAIVSDAIYPYNKGGKEKRIFEISALLAKKGHDVHIYTMHWWKGEKVKKVNGVTLHAISKYYQLYSGKRRSIKEALFFALACFKLLGEDFDILEADHMPHLVLFPLKIVSLIKKKNFFVTWNEVWGKDYWVEYMGLFGNIAYLIEKLSVQLPDEIISVSKHTAEKLKEDLHVTKPIHIITNGINIDEINKVKPFQKTSDIIYAGRLLEHKNLNILIKAVALLKKDYPNVTCQIIGNGPEENNLKKIVEEKGLEKNVRFYDFLSNQNDLYSYIKSSKVFVLPSTREGFGIVVLEANACGVPVVTINDQSNAARLLIENGKNGLTSQLSPKSIAKAITTFLKMPKQKLDFNMQVYSWRKLTESLLKVYR